MLEIADHLDPRPGYAWFLSQPAERDGFFCNTGGGYSGPQPARLGLRAALGRRAGHASAGASSLLPKAGLAMLRADESPAYWHGKGLACFFIMGEHEFRSHRHCDDYQIVLHGAGTAALSGPQHLELRERQGRSAGPTARSPTIRWPSTGPATCAAPYTQRHDFSPEVKFVAAQGQPFEKRDGIAAAAVGPQIWPKKVVLSLRPVPDQGVPGGLLLGRFADRARLRLGPARFRPLAVRPAEVPVEPGPGAVPSGSRTSPSRRRTGPGRSNGCSRAPAW